jgi:hypothetical protein
LIYNTQLFEFTDAQRAKEAWLSFESRLRPVDQTSACSGTSITRTTALATMWWDSAEACRRWAQEHESEAMEKLGGVTKSMEPEFLWEEF